MTGQCKLCNQLIVPPAMTMIDPTGLLEIRHMADAIFNHNTLYHREELSKTKGLERLFEARVLAQSARSSDPTYRKKLRVLSETMMAYVKNLDDLLDLETDELKPVPEEALPPGFSKVSS